MIKWEQMVFLGNPEYGCELQPIDFAAFARACGAQGFTIEDPAQCGAILDQALETPGPVVDRSGGRSIRAADAGEGHPGASGPFCRVPRARRT